MNRQVETNAFRQRDNTMKLKSAALFAITVACTIHAICQVYYMYLSITYPTNPFE